MINLSHINLSFIHLGGQDLSEIKLGYPSLGYSRENFDPASFDEAWTVTGKSNEDADRATIKNLTGNGNNLMLTNFGFAENSGYGKWPMLFNSNGSNVYGMSSPTKINITNRGVLTEAKFGYWKITNPSNKKYSFNWLISGLTDADELYVCQYNNNKYGSTRLKNGLNRVFIDAAISSKPDYPYISCYSTTLLTSNITIELVPDYEGYLVTDGVDDKVKSPAFKTDAKYTIIGDWKFLSNETVSSGILKVGQIYIYNQPDGLNIYINKANAANFISVKSLKAICSDGRCYDDNWNEILATTGNNGSNVSSLEIGGRSTTSFTQVAFKNLAFYNDKWLTKEQCTRAYDYLQTLKAK